MHNQKIHLNWAELYYIVFHVYCAVVWSDRRTWWWSQQCCVIARPPVCCKTLYDVCRSSGAKETSSPWPLVMFQRHYNTKTGSRCCTPDQEVISARPLSTVNMGERAGSLCYSNAALVISQLMSSPCYLSQEIHGFGAAAVVAAIF